MSRQPLWFESRHHSKTINVGHKQKSGQRTLARKKIYKKVDYPPPPPKRSPSLSLPIWLSLSLLLYTYYTSHGRRLAHMPPKFLLIHITNFRRGRVCGNANCANCTAVDCGSCRRCLKPSAKNKCIRRFSRVFIFMISCITSLQKLCHDMSPP